MGTITGSYSPYSCASSREIHQLQRPEIRKNMPPPISKKVVPTEPEVGKPEPEERFAERVVGLGVAEVVPVADDVPIGYGLVELNGVARGVGVGVAVVVAANITFGSTVNV